MTACAAPRLDAEAEADLRLADKLLRELEAVESRRMFFRYFPDDGPLRRELYAKHMEFIEAGSKYRQRAFLAANRIGKSDLGVYEVVCHATGQYPIWWKGRRFSQPVDIWVAGDKLETVREIIQAKLLGKAGEHGTGMLPAATIIRTTPRSGVPNMVDTIYVKSIFGGTSTIGLKSYDQGRISFQGTARHVILLDEEPPMDILTECLLRTMTCDGILLGTFTPLEGLSETVMYFLGGGDVYSHGDIDGRYVVRAEWDDVPHLSDKDKAELWDSIPPFQRDARSKGIPQLGAGAIYPVPESDFVVDDFAVPNFWPAGFGLDVGWNRTAAAFFHKDATAGTLYLTSEYYRGMAEPVVHASAIRAHGHWLRGVIDPAARGRSQKDGEALLTDYTRNLGLHLETADNSVEAGLGKTWELLSTGRLKVFKSCRNWLAEFRLYRRDEKGRIVKTNDHLMDATRYFVMSGRDRMTTEPAKHRERGGSPLVMAR